MKAKLFLLLILFIVILQKSNSQVYVQNVSPGGILNDYNTIFISSDVGFSAYSTPPGTEMYFSRTLDGGYSWNLMYKMPLSLSWIGGNMVFINRDTGFVFSFPGYHRTYDGGIHWDSFYIDKYFIPKRVYLNKFQKNPESIFVAASTSLGDKTLISFDYNNHWKSSDTVLFSTIIIDSLNIKSRGLYKNNPVYCNYLSQLIKSNNGGKTWLCISSPLQDTIYDVENFSFPSLDTGYAYRANKGLIKSTDGGITWHLKNNGLFSPVNYECPIAFPTPKVGYLLGPNWQIYQTRNGGNNWKKIYDLSIYQTNNANLYSFTEDTAYLFITQNAYFPNIYKLISKPLDIDTKQLISSLQIYPNPVNSDLKIEWSNPNKERFDISIYDELGRTFYHSSCNDDFKTIDVSKWAKGIYMIKIQSQNSIAIKKVIIN